MTNINIDKIQKLINDTYYWDSRGASLECNHFSDEVKLSFDDDDKRISYKFIGCYRAFFDHVKSYDKLKPVKDMTAPQIPYFLTDITVDEVSEEGVKFLRFKITMFPLFIEIWCQNVLVLEEPLD